MEKKETIVDVFLLEQMYKSPKMKVGTFGVMDTIDHKPVALVAYLSKQEGLLRALPYKKTGSIGIIPGNIKKRNFAEIIAVKLQVSIDEVLNSLPAGSFDFLPSKKSARVVKKIKKIK